MRKIERNKTKLSSCIVFLFSVLIGIVLGIFIAACMNSSSKSDASLGEILLYYIILFFLIYVSLFTQIIIHESGHLVFGLVTGYRFSSFRIGNFMWIKYKNKLHFKRFSLAGTGGQCLMVPPEMKNGRVPFVLYNLGGSLFNILFGILFLFLWFAFNGVPFLSETLLMLSVIGFMYALINGIPMRLGTIDNDGYNAISLGKSGESIRAFWIQMKINEQVSAGMRLKDMPDDWFFVPSSESMKNSMAAVIGVFTCNRLMDEQKFEEADRLMEEFISSNNAIVGLHRNLLVCDRIYCELIGENRKEKIDEMFDDSLKKFMKSMKNFPSVLRTEYAYFLLGKHDTSAAEQVRERFEKISLSYPYFGDIASERELLDFAFAKFKERKEII